MKRLAVVPVIAVALCFSACDSAPAHADKAAVEKTIRDYEDAWAKEMPDKNVTKVVAHYTPDAIVMGGGMPASKSPDAIRATFTQMMSDPNFTFQPTTDRVEVSDSGDMAVTRGTYNMTVTDPATKKAVTEKGSYMTVYHKQADGAWKASLDMIASETPPPAPAPVKAAKVTKKAAGKRRR